MTVDKECRVWGRSHASYRQKEKHNLNRYDKSSPKYLYSCQCDEHFYRNEKLWTVQHATWEFISGLEVTQSNSPVVFYIKLHIST